MGHPKIEDKDDTRDFIRDHLESSAGVDGIFQDSGPPLGADPFQVNTRCEEEGSDNRKLTALVQAFKLIDKDCTFSVFMSEILCLFQSLVPSSVASILEVNESDNTLFFRAVSDQRSEPLLSLTVPRGEGVAGFVADNQIPLLLSQVDESAMYLRNYQSTVGFEAKNVIAFPIIIQKRTFAVVELFNKIGSDRYTDQDSELLVSVAECVARLIEHRLILARLAEAA